jgi:hypothetical protein
MPFDGENTEQNGHQHAYTKSTHRDSSLGFGGWAIATETLDFAVMFHLVFENGHLVLMFNFLGPGSV